MDGSNEEEDEKTFDETDNDHDIADDHERSTTLESRSGAIDRFTLILRDSLDLLKSRRKSYVAISLAFSV